MAEEEANPEASSSAPSQPTGVKLFLGGLSWNTTEEDLRSHFGPYGKMHEVVVMRDRVTDKPRGFGFVTFADEAIADKVCAEKHELQGRQIDAKRSVPPTQQPRSKKVFVGGLAPATKEEDFQEYFARFGPVSEAQIMVDHQTGRSRGFGFVTFEQASSVEQVFRMGAMHELAGKRVEVKSATPRGSGPIMPSRGLPMGRIWGSQRPMPGRGFGLYPGQIPQAGFGMGPYGPVGYNPAVMGAYPLNAFGPSPYGPYGNPLMAAQMNQMGQLGGFGFGNFGPYGAAGGFSPQALAAASQQGLPGPQQNLPGGFDQQPQGPAEDFPQNSPNARFQQNFPGRGQQR